MRPVNYLFFKRISDIILALAVILTMWPLFALIAALIVFTSRGGAIFKQQRVGQDGRIFELYKFRTMDIDTPAYIIKPKEDDSRITGVGRFLRKCFLDELPQVFNVLKGQMSFVGPRPEMPFIVKEYTLEQKERLKIKPGLTGAWQISACTAEPINDNLQYDLEYIRNCSFWLDLKILSSTLAIFFKNLKLAAKNYFSAKRAG